MNKVELKREIMEWMQTKRLGCLRQLFYFHFDEEPKAHINEAIYDLANEGKLYVNKCFDVDERNHIRRRVYDDDSIELYRRDRDV